jgi:amidase
MDTVGPMAKTIAGLRLGMELLEPGFVSRDAPVLRVGRIRTSSLPEVEAAVDVALNRAELEVVPIDLDLDTGTGCFTAVYFAELWEVDHELVETAPEEVGDDVTQFVQLADVLRSGAQDARDRLMVWRQQLIDLFSRVELLALPTLTIFPPRLAELGGNLTDVVVEITRHTSLFNAAGVPCTAQPVPVTGSALPASLQLVGPLGGEEILLPTAQRIESALA